jgi:HSP20 family protein
METMENRWHHACHPTPECSDARIQNNKLILFHLRTTARATALSGIPFALFLAEVAVPAPPPRGMQKNKFSSKQKKKGDCIMRTYWNWNPFRELDTLHRELDRVFGDALPSGKFPFSRIPFLSGPATHAYPLMNACDDENALHVEALAPGINPSTLKITVVNNQLTIGGEKAAQPADAEGKKAESYYRNERADGQFIRSITLPVEVDPSKVEAVYKNGVLSITLPKAEAAKPKQITVHVA